MLVYAILERLKFDVGYFVHRSLLEAARSRSTGGISHPHLITTLCLQVGVQTLDHKERVRAISELPVTRVRARAPEVPAADDVDHGEGRVVDSDEEVRDDEGPSEEPARSSAPVSVTLTLEYLHCMSERREAFFAELRKQSDRLMTFLYTMKEGHDFELWEQRVVTDRMTQRLDSLFRNQRSAMNN